MRFSTIFTALFCPYIAHEQTAQNLDYVSSLVALPSLSYWAPSLPKWRFAQERRVIEWFQRAMCPALQIGWCGYSLQRAAILSWVRMSMFNIHMKCMVVVTSPHECGRGWGEGISWWEAAKYRILTRMRGLAFILWGLSAADRALFFSRFAYCSLFFMDHVRSNAHFRNFQIRSSLNRS